MTQFNLRVNGSWGDASREAFHTETSRSAGIEIASNAGIEIASNAGIEIASNAGSEIESNVDDYIERLRAGMWEGIAGVAVLSFVREQAEHPMCIGVNVNWDAVMRDAGGLKKWCADHTVGRTLNTLAFQNHTQHARVESLFLSIMKKNLHKVKRAFELFQQWYGGSPTVLFDMHSTGKAHRSCSPGNSQPCVVCIDFVMVPGRDELLFVIGFLPLPNQMSIPQRLRVAEAFSPSFLKFARLGVTQTQVLQLLQRFQNIHVPLRTSSIFSRPIMTHDEAVVYSHFLGAHEGDGEDDPSSPVSRNGRQMGTIKIIPYQTLEFGNSQTPLHAGSELNQFSEIIGHADDLSELEREESAHLYHSLFISVPQRQLIILVERIYCRELVNAVLRLRRLQNAAENHSRGGEGFDRLARLICDEIVARRIRGEPDIPRAHTRTCSTPNEHHGCCNEFARLTTSSPKDRRDMSVGVLVRAVDRLEFGTLPHSAGAAERPERMASASQRIVATVQTEEHRDELSGGEGKLPETTPPAREKDFFDDLLEEVQSVVPPNVQAIQDCRETYHLAKIIGVPANYSARQFASVLTDHWGFSCYKRLYVMPIAVDRGSGCVYIRLHKTSDILELHQKLHNAELLAHFNQDAPSRAKLCVGWARVHECRLVDKRAKWTANDISDGECDPVPETRRECNKPRVARSRLGKKRNGAVGRLEETEGDGEKGGENSERAI